MKLKPFYVKTEGLTDQKAQELLDLAVDAGATPFEWCSKPNKHDCWGSVELDASLWALFGVTDDGGTLFYDKGEIFGSDAVEMTYDEAWAYLKGLIASNSGNGVEHSTPTQEIDLCGVKYSNAANAQEVLAIGGDEVYRKSGNVVDINCDGESLDYVKAVLAKCREIYNL